ncbi:hypothetical protein Tco_1101611 [Tanacetum coccineum]
MPRRLEAYVARLRRNIPQGLRRKHFKAYKQSPPPAHSASLTSNTIHTVLRGEPNPQVIMEYLVNISKRRAFWSLNEDILKINDFDCQYAVSIKEDTAYPCLHSPKTTKETSSIRQYSEEEVAETMAETMEQYMSKTRADYGSGEVILFYNGLDIPTRQILDSRGAIPSKTASDVKTTIQEMVAYSQKWHNGTSRGRSTKTSNGLAAIQAQLNNLGREIKKSNSSRILSKGQRKSFVPRIKAINGRYLEKIMRESAKRHEENSNLIKEIRASTDAAIRNQGASIKTLEIQIDLRERMELDLEARVMGDTLVLNRSLDPFFEDYIDLNDLNKPFKLRRNQGDDLMPEGEVIEEFRTRDDELDTEIDDYPILEYMDAYRDEGMGDVIFGEPFLREVGIKARRFEGEITITMVMMK